MRPFQREIGDAIHLPYFGGGFCASWLKSTILVLDSRQASTDYLIR